MRTEDDTGRSDIWRWIWDDADELGASEERSHAPVLVAVLEAEEEPDLEPPREEAAPAPQPPPLETLRPVTIVPPLRARRSARKRARRRLLAIGLAAGMLGAGAVGAIRLATRDASEHPAAPPAGTTGGVAVQRVVAFAVWDEAAGPGYVAVLTAGGGQEPIAVVLPDATAVTIPGHGLGTVANATRSGDVTVVRATAENLLGVRVDDAIGMPLEALGPLVDSLGLLEVGGELADGDDVVRYLSHRRGRPAPERVARWQEVLGSLLTTARGRADDLGGIPARLRPVFASGAEVLALPTEEIGAGLVRPDVEGIEDLVAERFVATDATPGTSAVRLVVLNGNGAPGVGEAVASILVPEGFRLVTNLNWETFDLETTQILAASREYLDEARLARRLLGVGDVFLDATQSGVADVTVVVGDDFGRP